MIKQQTKRSTALAENVLMCTAGGSYTEDLLTTESKVDELIATRPLTKLWQTGMIRQ